MAILTSVLFGLVCVLSVALYRALRRPQISMEVVEEEKEEETPKSKWLPVLDIPDCEYVIRFHFLQGDRVKILGDDSRKYLLADVDGSPSQACEVAMVMLDLLQGNEKSP